jgi:hypothetical protein
MAQKKLAGKKGTMTLPALKGGDNQTIGSKVISSLKNIDPKRADERLRKF